MNSDIFWNSVRESEQIVNRGMFIGVIMIILCIPLFYFMISVSMMSFFFSIASVFGVIYFIMNYRTWKIINRIKEKKYIHNNDLLELKKIRWRGIMDEH